MLRRVHSHIVTDVHIVAREALAYLLVERAMALAVSLMFACSYIVILSFGGGGEDDKVDWPGWPRFGRSPLPNEIIVELYCHLCGKVLLTPHLALILMPSCAGTWIWSSRGC